MDKAHYPFVSRKAELIYYLTQLDGEARCKALGIEEEHYESEALAKEWLNKLVADLGGSITDESRAAIDRLLKMYEVMTYRGKEEKPEGDPRFKMMPPDQAAYDQIAGFVTSLTDTLTQAYYEGSWWQHRGVSPTAEFVDFLIDRVILAFAGVYLPSYDPDLQPWPLLQRDEIRFVLITQLGEGEYPNGFDIIGNAPALRPLFLGAEGVLDRLYLMYGRTSRVRSLGQSNLDPEKLVKLVIAHLFAGMAAGHPIGQQPIPSAKLCIARRVQDVKIDARLTIDASYVLTPVFKVERFPMDQLDEILGLVEPEGELAQKPSPKFKDISPSVLSKLQRLKAEQLALGEILAAYIENGRTFMTLAGDGTGRPYVWIEKPGFWRHIREGEDYWRY